MLTIQKNCVDYYSLKTNLINGLQHFELPQKNFYKLIGSLEKEKSGREKTKALKKKKRKKDRIWEFTRTHINFFLTFYTDLLNVTKSYPNIYQHFNSCVG